MTTTIGQDGLSPAELAVRFFHLEKLPTVVRANLSPSAFDPIGAAIAGVTPDEFRRVRAELLAAKDAAATELLNSPGMADTLAALPFERGDVIVALGDSITDDLTSWAAQLETVLAVGRPDLDLRVINAGFTGNTTQEAISRFDTIARLAPTWIIQMLGTNDARLHGESHIRTTSPQETSRNFAALRDLVAKETDARLICVTPPPVDGERADAWAPFHAEKITWRATDLDQLVVNLITEASVPVIDIYQPLWSLPPEQWLLPDGVHPSTAGQSLIARAVIEALASPTVGGLTHDHHGASPHQMTERSQ